MNDDKRADPRFCGSNFAYQYFPFTHFLNDMVELGRSKLELWGIAPHLSVPELARNGASHISKQLRERELVVHCFTPEQVMYPINLAAEEPWLLASSRQSMEEAIHVAAQLESPLMLVTAGRGYEHRNIAPAWERALESLGILADKAHREGISLLLEPLQRSESNIVTTAAELDKMLGEIGRANVQVVLDTVAVTVAGDSVEDYLRRFKKRIGHVHLVDGKPSGHLAWGDGYLPLADYVSHLEGSGYQGQYTFELFGDYANDPRAAFQRCLSRAVASCIRGDGCDVPA
ncbi:sugar phosphate isomerase/epimerase family protein [Arthrobacter cryoconiti]|uniref:Sugar phosphate isomerase/epimerase family protein n=1 Tax=Arthrobacter cryoconiti TaxID=748907 RepID=A0ABV8QW14_9MICC|nr:sugar phosphate isomerase/epimerase family protein [Arthrobacter cryoconiti]MCC9069704.1 sugar phosphate isomerase/epimerase [Arthrobacter cryoconiti]